MTRRQVGWLKSGIAFNTRVFALAAILAVSSAQSALADWFGIVTLPDRIQLRVDVADTQHIVPGKPFVGQVTLLDGKIDPLIFVPSEITVVGNSISVVARDETGKKLTLSLIRRPNIGSGDGA